MNRFLYFPILSILIIITGCASPKYSGTGIPQEILSANPDVLSINDTETRDGYQVAVEKWLSENNLNFVVKPENAQHDPEKITIEYVGYWKWDMALYLSNAEMEAFYKGKSVSKVNFNAPNSLNANKWGDAETRIGLMMDIMFGKKTATEATKQL